MAPRISVCSPNDALNSTNVLNGFWASFGRLQGGEVKNFATVLCKWAKIGVYIFWPVGFVTWVIGLISAWTFRWMVVAGFICLIIRRSMLGIIREGK
jgi:hypothetical protein